MQENNLKFIIYKKNQYLKNSDIDGIFLLNKLLFEKIKHYDWKDMKIVSNNSLIEELKVRNYNIDTLEIYISNNLLNHKTKIKIQENILECKYSSKEEDLMLIGMDRDRSFLYYCLSKNNITLNDKDRPIYGLSFLEEIEKFFNKKTFHFKIKKN